MKVLFIGHPNDNILNRLQRELAQSNIDILVCFDIRLLQFQYELSDEKITSKIFYKGHEFDTHNLSNVIIVSEIRSSSNLSNTNEEDFNYLNSEWHAAIFSLFAFADCRVLNRPSKTFPFNLFQGFVMNNYLASNKVICSIEEIMQGKDINIANSVNSNYRHITSGTTLFDTYLIDKNDYYLCSYSFPLIYFTLVSNSVFKYSIDNKILRRIPKNEIERVENEIKHVAKLLSLDYAQFSYSVDSKKLLFRTLTTFSTIEFPLYNTKLIVNKLKRVISDDGQ